MSTLITPSMAVDDLYKLSGMDISNDTDSLNAGYDDEEDDVYFSEIEFTDLLDINKIINEAISIESRINDLVYLADDIQKASGMNQTFAMEAEKLVPGFGGVPIGFYTKDTSATRFKVSLEEISKSIWALITAGIKFVIDVIKKIFNFFGGNKKSAEEKIETEISNIEDAEDSTSEANKTIASADALLSRANLILLDSNKKAFECSSFQIAIDKFLINDERYGRAKEFLEFKNSIYHDLIKHGKYFNAVISIGERLKSIDGVFKLKTDIIVNVIRTDINSTLLVDDLENIKKLKMVSKPIEVSFLNHTKSLTDITNELASIRKQVSESTVNDSINFDSLFSSISEAYTKSKITDILKEVKKSFTTLEDMRVQLEKLETVSRNLALDGTPGATSGGVGEVIRNAVAALAKDQISYASLYNELMHFTNFIKELTNHAIGFSQIIIKKITDEMHANKQEVPEGWQKVVDNLKHYKETIKFNHLRRK